MRVNLTDGSGRWFSSEYGTRYEEAARFDGNNRISVATGTQWDHEALYRTRGGVWVLHAWSQWQGTLPSYREITAKQAELWLAVHEHWAPPHLSLDGPDEAEAVDHA